MAELHAETQKSALEALDGGAMYTEYFGFRETPFTLTPDPRFFYSNPVYQEAYASLVYGISERKGFIVLTGEVGTGKTTLLRRLMNSLEASVRFVFFYNTTLTFDELLSFTCQELGLPAQGQSRLQKIQMLNEFLIAQLTRGGTVALLIDEAQHLANHALETLRLLSNLETQREKLLQIVLVGQPELETKLDHPRLRPINQRVAVRYRLSRLKDREVGPFIYHRLQMVGYQRDDLFPSETVQRIALYSQGIPRLINILCDSALLAAYGDSRKRVSPDLIDEVAHDLRLKPAASAPSLEPAPAVSGPATVTASHGQVVPALAPERRASRRRPRAAVLRPGRAAAAATAAILALAVGIVAFVSPIKAREVVGRLGLAIESLVSPIKAREAFGKAREGVGRVSLAIEGLLTSAVRRPGGTGHVGVTPPTQETRGAAPASTTARESSTGAPPLHAALPRSPGMEPTTAAAVPPTPSRPGVDEQPETRGAGGTRVLIQDGTNVSAIAFDAYGESNPLILDLIKQSNPHIADLNWVMAGQTLWLPPVTQDTLLRKRPDGSYRLILAAFDSSQRAEKLARDIRLDGYRVEVTRGEISPGIALHRVEIVGLETNDAVTQTWQTAVTKRWLRLPGVAQGGTSR